LIAAEHPGRFVAGEASSDVPELDALLGGGINHGTSSLILGPAGTGKSTIALQYAWAAAKRKEKVILFLFEEDRRTLLTRASSVGLPLAQLVKSGRIELVQVDPAQLAPGQFVDLVKSKVEAGVRMIVIDSLNGYLQAMPNVKFLEIQLHEMLSFASHHGVVSIMTLAQHGLMGQMNSPVDLTYLADTVILLRYFEESGRIRKAVSVIKKRIGRHEDAIREFRLDRKGLRVGAPLENFHGVLTGVPTFRGSGRDILKDR
jgi:circadian clock protein KaiC